MPRTSRGRDLRDVLAGVSWDGWRRGWISGLRRGGGREKKKGLTVRVRQQCCRMASVFCRSARGVSVRPFFMYVCCFVYRFEDLYKAYMPMGAGLRRQLVVDVVVKMLKVGGGWGTFDVRGFADGDFDWSWAREHDEHLDSEDVLAW